jgi:hypothetical protein
MQLLRDRGPVVRLVASRSENGIASKMVRKIEPTLMSGDDSMSQAMLSCSTELK